MAIKKTGGHYIYKQKYIYIFIKAFSLKVHILSVNVNNIEVEDHLAKPVMHSGVSILDVGEKNPVEIQTTQSDVSIFSGKLNLKCMFSEAFEELREMLCEKRIISYSQCRKHISQG